MSAAFRKTECFVPTCPKCGGDLLDREEMVPHCEHPWLGPDDPEADELRCATCDPIPYAPIERSPDGTERVGWPTGPVEHGEITVISLDSADGVIRAIEAGGVEPMSFEFVREAPDDHRLVELSIDLESSIFPGATPPETVKTPDEWLAELRPGTRVLDPDGWRGRNGRPWTDPITRAEFERRFALSTITGPAQP